MSVRGWLLALACSALAACERGSERVGWMDPPAASGARSFSLAPEPSGGLRLTWLEGREELALRSAVLLADGWAEARTLASGRDWFVNWADVPRASAAPSGAVLGTYLERSGTATYDYRVRAVLDGGVPQTLHDDAGVGEHGFVSLVPRGDAGWLAVWLDGRATAGHHDGTGEMQLRARSVALDGALGPELLLDPRVCDCCATAAVRTASGDVLVVYRDRSADEVRDFSAISVRADGTVGASVSVSDDGWKIPGCPVNGAALAARDGEVAVAWFTLGAESRARVSVAFSRDGGASFSSPLQVSSTETDGFVDCVYDGRGALWVTWLERPVRERGEWRLAQIENGVVGPARTLARTVPGRAAGLARLGTLSDRLCFVWLESGDEPRLRAQLVSTQE
jgi:hypothetical protein